MILSSTLRKGILDKEVDNEYARGLLFLLDSNPVKLPEPWRLLSINVNRKQEIDETKVVIDDRQVTDYRLLNLRVSGVRKFPLGKERKEDKEWKKWYTISFNEGGKPVSSIFLGGNGVGKSSLYAALEYVSIGHSYLADEHDSAQAEYLINNQLKPDEDALIQIKTQQCEESISLKSGSLNQLLIAQMITASFFLSDYDIHEISRKGLTSEYITTQLGLQRYNKLLGLMKELKEGYNNNKDKYEETEHHIKYIENLLHIRRFLGNLSNEKIKTCKSSINNISNSLKKHSRNDLTIKQIHKLYEKLCSFRDNLLLRDTIYIATNVCTDLSLDIKKIKDKIREYKEIDESDRFNQQSILNDCLQLIEDILSIWIKEIQDRVDFYKMHTSADYYHIIILPTEDELNKNRERNKEAKNKCLLLEKDSNYIVNYNATFSFLNEQYNTLIKEYNKIINEILPPVFSSYFDEDIQAINAKVGESLIRVEIQPKSPESNHTLKEESDDKLPPVEPRKFLNTFRFKAFCFILKFALACCVKKYHKVNFPFVVDDVFDASDFGNRSSIGELIKSIIDVHNGKLSLHEMPLQLIFFTQDDLIADSIYRESFNFDEVKFSRLFDYYHAEDKDIFESESEGYKDVSIEEML